MSTSLPPFVWINGEIAPTELARLSPFDHGLLVGDGAFETLITYRGHPFALHRHWLRLEASCGVLDIPAPDEAILRVALLEVMLANQLTDARVRITAATVRWARIAVLWIRRSSSRPFLSNLGPKPKH